MADITVIGIDPAPSKNTIIYSDEEGFISKHSTKLKEYVVEKAKDNVLLCWDAPLTVGMLDSKDESQKYSNFNWRHIEYVINYKMEDKKPANGISIMGYASCSHWVITQYCLGLQKVNCNTDDNILFKLVDSVPSNGANIVEVHPALALWCLLWDKCNSEKEWPYKKDKSCLKDSIAIINEWAKKYEWTCPDIVSDDHLDAYIAWLLGKLWVTQDKNKDDVILVGNKDTGAILLPNTQWSRDLSSKL